MKRGDVVIVSGKGDYGKSRPAIVVQNGQLIGEITPEKLQAVDLGLLFHLDLVQRIGVSAGS